MKMPANLEFWAALGLVFAAVVSFVVVFAKTAVEAMKASEERLDLAQTNLQDVGDVSPMSRFVSRAMLFRLRVVSAAVPALVVPVVLVTAGIRSAWAVSALAIVFAAVFWRLPLAYFSLLVRRRQAMFEMDVLDLAVGLDNALRAGMALPQALDRISARMHGVMKEELDVVQREYRLGTDLVQALERLCRRMPCEDVRLLVSAIRLTTEAGGSLSDILKEMVQMIRSRREFQDKVKSLTAEGRFEAIAMSLAPVAVFLLLYFQQPELMRVLYTTVIGWCSLGVVAALDLTGFWVIHKIVTIEV